MSVMRLRRYGGVGITVSDPDANDFVQVVSACSPLSNYEANAINNLVIELKSSGLWGKCFALYPFVGGSACAHKYNLKDARDLDAAYRLTFLNEGSMTHGPNGVKPNLSRASSNFLPSYAAQNSLAMWYYSRENAPATNSLMGVSASGSDATCLLTPRFNDETNSNYDSVNKASSVSTSITNTSGLLGVNRILSTETKSFRNGASYLTRQINSSVPLDFPIYLFGRLGTTQYTTLECAFSAITQGLTDAEALSFYEVVQTFQVSLNRQV